MKNRNKLKNMDVMYKYGFLYQEFKIGRYYWEFIKMLLKLKIS